MTSIKQSKTTYHMCNTQFKAKSSAYKASLKYINIKSSNFTYMQHII